jgi:hypothetical protein
LHLPKFYSLRQQHIVVPFFSSSNAPQRALGKSLILIFAPETLLGALVVLAPTLLGALVVLAPTLLGALVVLAPTLLGALVVLAPTLLGALS